MWWHVQKGPDECLYINCHVSPDPSSTTPKTSSAMKTLDPQNHVEQRVTVHLKEMDVNVQDWMGQGQHPSMGSCECSDDPSGSIHNDKYDE